MENIFIKNEDALEEDYRTDDLLDFSEITSDFRNTLEKIEKNSVIGLIGKFGSGKSTMLYQLQKERGMESLQKWIIFDAWKYPERKDLWEGFVLDFANQIGKGKKIAKKIDGKSSKSAAVDIGTDILSLISEQLSGFNLLDKFVGIFKSSPAKRVFEIQEILKELISEQKKDIYIIVEDIDRSGDSGIFFLETLRNFIKETSFDKKVIVIVPIGNEYFEGKERQSYLKTLDYRVNFKISKVGYKRFIEEIFSEKAAGSDKFTNQVDYLFRFISIRKNLTIREIKHILRLSYLRFRKLSNEEQEKIDSRVFILFESLDYLGEQFISIINNEKRLKSDFWGKDYLLMVANNLDETELNRGDYKRDIPFFLKGDNYVPVFHRDMFNEGRGGYYLTEKYINY